MNRNYERLLDSTLVGAALFMSWRHYGPENTFIIGCIVFARLPTRPAKAVS